MRTSDEEHESCGVAERKMRALQQLQQLMLRTKSVTLLHLLQLEAASCGYRRGQPVLTGVTLCVEQVRR